MSDPGGRHPGAVRLGIALIAITSVAPLVQHAIPALAPHLVREFDLSKSELGVAATVLFGTTAVLAPAMGRLTDRVSPRVVTATVFLMGALGAVLVAGAPHYSVVVAASIVLGVPMALAHPVTNRLLLAHSSGRALSVLVAVKHSGIKVAQSAAGLVLAPLAALVGWRAAFAVPAVLSAVGAAWVPRYVGRLKSPPEHSEPVSARLPASMWWLMAYSVLMGLSQSALATYTAIYAFEAVSFTATSAGLLTGMLGITGVAARIGWGVWAHGLKGVRPLQAMALGSVPATAGLIAAQVVGAPLLWVAVIALGITSSIWNLCVTIVVFRLVPPTLTGQATGRVYLGFAAGMMVGPLVFGLIVDLTGHYDGAWGSLMAWQLLAALTTLPLLRDERRRAS